MDALADPRAYLSAQEKRKEALHNMGVDDADIAEVQPPSNSQSSRDLKNATRQMKHNDSLNDVLRE